MEADCILSSSFIFRIHLSSFAATCKKGILYRSAISMSFFAKVYLQTRRFPQRTMSRHGA